MDRRQPEWRQGAVFGRFEQLAQARELQRIADESGATHRVTEDHRIPKATHRNAVRQKETKTISIMFIVVLR